MKLEDFAKADCCLLRQSVVTDSINATIESLLLQAWASGATAEAAVERLLSNRELFDALSEQVAETLRYRRSMQQEMLRQQHVAQKELRLAARKRQLEQLHERQQKEADALRDKNAVDAAQQATNEASRQVERLREQVNKRKETLGGAKVLQVLEKLRLKPLAPQPNAAEVPPPESLDDEDEQASALVDTAPTSQPSQETEIETPIDGLVSSAETDDESDVTRKDSASSSGRVIDELADATVGIDDTSGSAAAANVDSVANYLGNARDGTLSQATKHVIAHPNASSADVSPGSVLPVEHDTAGQGATDNRSEKQKPATNGLGRGGTSMTTRRPHWLFSGRIYRWFQRTPRRRRVFKVISHDLW